MLPCLPVPKSRRFWRALRASTRYARGRIRVPAGTPWSFALGVELSDEMLSLALTHRSYAYEHGGLPTNERLEFLGDAVLGLTIGLYRDAVREARRAKQAEQGCHRSR